MKACRCATWEGALGDALGERRRRWIVVIAESAARHDLEDPRGLPGLPRGAIGEYDTVLSAVPDFVNTAGASQRWPREGRTANAAVDAHHRRAHAAWAGGDPRAAWVERAADSELW